MLLCKLGYILAPHLVTSNLRSTWDAVSSTNWNATAGEALVKVGSTGPAVFLACKRPSTTSKAGAYVLILQTPDTTLPESFSSGDGDVLTRALCTRTKILVTPGGGSSES